MSAALCFASPVSVRRNKSMPTAMAAARNRPAVGFTVEQVIGCPVVQLLHVNAQSRNVAGFARLELVNWLAAAVVCLVLASAHMLDGPSEIEAAADVAADVAEAQASAHAVALATARLTQPWYQP